MALTLYDAHNHLQDVRLDALREPALREAVAAGLRRMVVNGSCPEDWPDVRSLAECHAEVRPCFGVHPWHVKELPGDWREQLLRQLDQGACGVGEAGLDRWVKDFDLALQEEVFVWQLRMAAERNLPLTIHCLKAWGRLDELLREGPRPERGFLLHSYGGPAEMVPGLAELGAYFSISGYFAHERKARQREAFKQVPPDRLLIETDAPDMWPPPEWNEHPLPDGSSGRMINHPANIAAVYRFAADLLGRELPDLADQVAQNFVRLFGG